MKNLLPLIALSLLISGCKLNSEKANSKAKPISIGFYETYTIQKLASTLTSIDTWISENDSILKVRKVKPVSLNMVLQPGAGAIIGTILPQHKDQLNAVLQLKELKTILPKDLKFVWSIKPTTTASNTPKFELYAIRIPSNGKPKVNGKHVKTAISSLDQNSGRIVINIEMTTDGQVEWYELTSKNIYKSIAITADDEVISCPNVINAIDGGSTQITGNFSQLEAKIIADGINAGR